MTLATTASGAGRSPLRHLPVLAAVFAAVVMYDAAGVRRAVSLQARVLNRMLTEMIEAQHFNEERMRELIGHTPFEVFVGALLGVLSAISLR